MFLLVHLGKPVVYEEPVNPCVPTPCGPNSQCRTQNNLSVCSCLPSYIGRAPNCRPECTVNSDCPSNLGCINQKCTNPCIGSCGLNAECIVSSHIPLCTCLNGFSGDPFKGCYEKPQSKTHQHPLQSPPIETYFKFSVSYLPPDESPCTRNPCGTNAKCRELNGAGSCACIPNYYGDPYVACRPECMMNSECPMHKACINTRCQDPCPGICGSNAICSVLNHSPNCVCLSGYRGNPFESCTRIPESKNRLSLSFSSISNKIHFDQVVREEPIVDPCQPSPCGPNSQCRKVNNVAVCSCIASYIGSPPNCRPECVVNADCSLDKSCTGYKCRDPCPGTCGINARCQVVNHSPICSCHAGFVGDPFIRCVVEESKKEKKLHEELSDANLSSIENLGRPPPIQDHVNPCHPSPCGLNSNCRENNGQPVCSCIPNYIGAPPNCRPECIQNSECPSNLACVNTKCVDPCPGLCGFNAICSVRNHQGHCQCQPQFSGDPYSQCSPVACKNRHQVTLEILLKSIFS
jgi:hypothetical protein